VVVLPSIADTVNEMLSIATPSAIGDEFGV